MSMESGGMKNEGLLSERPGVKFLAVFLVFCFGLLLRVERLTTPPLDFLSGRQLRSAIIARGMYCTLVPCADPVHRKSAIAMWKNEDIYEPQINERLVSTTYLLTGKEFLWISRLWGAFYWLTGAIFLYDLARRMTSVDGALIAVGYYAIQPFIVIAGRSFQPEPFATMWAILAVYSMYRWAESRQWKWVILTGILGGMAILIKIVAVFPVVMIFTWITLRSWGFKRIFHDLQIWTIVLFLISIPSIYYFGMIGNRSSSFFDFWTLSFLNRLIQPAFYVGWLKFLHGLFSLTVIFIGLASALTLQPLGRAVILGWWTGYILYGFFLPVQVTTHDYYNLILAPAVALSLAAAGDMIFTRLSKQQGIWRMVIALISLIALFYPFWITFSIIRSKSADLQYEAMGWQEIGREIPQDGSLIGLTHDYGNRLRYYGWREITPWPYSFDINLKGDVDLGDEDYRKMFNEATSGKKYFVVTEFNELDAQTQLKEILYNNFPIIQEAAGYIVFDLSQQLIPKP
jgi:4-amino-4-deoxy-L-arabinose transferase-like glycosyltransferase